MKSRKHLVMVATLVLLAGLCDGAIAQARMDRQDSAFRLRPEPIVSVVHVNAIEVSDGVIGVDNQTKMETVFGYSFLGRTTGSFPGSFTLSMNCMPATSKPGESNELTGGVWTLPVYLSGTKGTGYAGSLSGTIAKGTIKWDKAGTNAYIEFLLNVDLGTQAWDGVKGYATFVGTMFVDEKTQKTMLSGELVFAIG